MPRHKLTFAAAATALVALFPGVALAAPAAAAAASYHGWGWIGAYLGAFGAGFLTSLTPCVYPMIPIVVGIFGARDEAVTRRRAFALATLYVLGMGVTFSSLGVAFALVGSQSNALLANPWVVWPVVAIYTLLAASMFGAFDLNLPMSWQNRLNRVGGKGYGGAFGMGLVGGLTAAPCTGPFVLGILGLVSRQGDVAAGASLLFVYALGIGVLFWAIAVFAVSLPKSGRWMEWIKSIGGIALLAVGVYFLRPVVPALTRLTNPSFAFLAVGIGLAVAGVGLGAVHLSFHDRAAIKIRKAIGVALMVAGLTGVVNWAVTPNRELPWRHDEAAAFAAAKAQGKGVMVDFSAKWCAPCQRLGTLFGKPGLYDAIVASYVPLEFDVTHQTDRDTALQKKYDAGALPTVIFLDADHHELGRFTDHTPSVASFRKALEAAKRAGSKRARR